MKQVQTGANQIPKIVFIAGISYCGSTILQYVLGSLPNTIAVSEVRRVLQKERCMSCPPGECPHFPLPEGKELREKYFYYDLAQHLGVDKTIVSGDKLLRFFLGRVKGCKTFPIISFRHPLSMLASHVANKNVNPGVVLKQINQAYSSLIQNLENPIFLDFDYFMHNKATTLKALCYHLGLEFDQKALEYWNFSDQHHTFGGNGGANQQKRNPPPREFEDKVDFPEYEYSLGLEKNAAHNKNFHKHSNYLDVKSDQRWKFLLSPEILSIATQHPAMQTYWELVAGFKGQMIDWWNHQEGTK